MADDSTAGVAEQESANTASSTVVSLPKQPLPPTHPLQYKWTMWYNRKCTTAWSVDEVCSFDTVEGFWCLYNHLLAPSELQTGANYHLFKYGVAPEWEDAANARGGKWVLSIPVKEKEPLNQVWLYTILAMVGESFDDSAQICGAVCSPRKKENRVALWTRDASDGVAVRRIGGVFKANVGAHHTIGYQAHDDALASKAAHRYEV